MARFSIEETSIADSSLPSMTQTASASSLPIPPPPLEKSALEEGLSILEFNEYQRSVQEYVLALEAALEQEIKRLDERLVTTRQILAQAESGGESGNTATAPTTASWDSLATIPEDQLLAMVSIPLQMVKIKAPPALPIPTAPVPTEPAAAPTSTESATTSTAPAADGKPAAPEPKDTPQPTQPANQSQEKKPEQQQQQQPAAESPSRTNSMSKQPSSQPGSPTNESSPTQPSSGPSSPTSKLSAKEAIYEAMRQAKSKQGMLLNFGKKRFLRGFDNHCVVVTEEGMSWYKNEREVKSGKPVDSIPFYVLTTNSRGSRFKQAAVCWPLITTQECPKANDPKKTYFGIQHTDPKDGSLDIITFGASSPEERDEWVFFLTKYIKLYLAPAPEFMEFEHMKVGAAVPLHRQGVLDGEAPR